jgi:hypothetical protein
MMPHEHTPGWGMAPVLFSIGVVAVSSYAVFMTLAVEKRDYSRNHSAKTRFTCRSPRWSAALSAPSFPW